MKNIKATLLSMLFALATLQSCREGSQNEGTNTPTENVTQNNTGETEGARNAQGVDANGAGGSAGSSENNAGQPANGNDSSTSGSKGTTAPTSTGANNPATVKDNTGTNSNQ